MEVEMVKVDITLTLTLLLPIFITTGSNHVERNVTMNHVTGAVLINMKMTIRMEFAHRATHHEAADLLAIRATNSPVPDPRLVTTTIAKHPFANNNHL